MTPRPVEPMDATPFLPRADALLDTHARRARCCRGCPLWRGGEQAVFGAGPADARLMIVGEQPGDREDREGRPFVGPAGRELDHALAAAGIDRGDAYVTNVVKHFKFKRRGKRRIHDKPSGNEVRACRPWLERELELVGPEVLLLMGATAARGLLGHGFKVTRERGRELDSPLAPTVTATIHPSAILRADDSARHELRASLISDLGVAAAALARQGS